MPWHNVFNINETKPREQNVCVLLSLFRVRVTASKFTYINKLWYKIFSLVSDKKRPFYFFSKSYISYLNLGRNREKYRLVCANLTGLDNRFC